MRICIGDVVESVFGKGPIVAITDEWIVHDTGDGHEAALPKQPDGQWWVPVTDFGANGTLHQSLEIDA